MSYNVLIRDEAYAEALEAYLFYEDKQDGLGEKFLGSLQNIYERLALTPNYYSVLVSDRKRILRDIKLKDSPYIVIFEIADVNVIVYAVHNTHKKLSIKKYKHRK